MKSRDYKQSYEKLSQNITYSGLSKVQFTRQVLSNQSLPKYLVIDCSMFSFIDFSGISTLKKIIQAFEGIGIQTALSGVHVHLESMLAKEGFFNDIPTDHMYKTIHDAVVSLQELDGEYRPDDVFNAGNIPIGYTGDDSPITMSMAAQHSNHSSNMHSFKTESSLNHKIQARNGPKRDSLFLSLGPNTSGKQYGFPADKRLSTLSYLSTQSRSTPEIAALYPLKKSARESYVRMDGVDSPPSSPHRSSAPNIDFLFDFDLPSTPSEGSSNGSFAEPTPAPTATPSPLRTDPSPLPQMPSHLYPQKAAGSPKTHRAPPPPVRVSSAIPVPPPLPPTQTHIPPPPPPPPSDIPAPPPQPTLASPPPQPTPDYAKKPIPPPQPPQDYTDAPTPAPPPPPPPPSGAPVAQQTPKAIPKIPVPPPLPTVAYRQSPKVVKKSVQPKQSAAPVGVSAIPEPKEDYMEDEGSDAKRNPPPVVTKFKANNRVSARLLARQEMLEKVYNQDKRISGAPRMSDA
ncbi:unnamed protein product [Medioppia subpectinata]|uniref:STAS domain-containing protein n=1 Tax=Medioppia subpectinata TaxID=1979941 RepID=A0A7R9LEU4_9ACAR|nr:unnamed protein product [Medioppia subpectinata]CAG2118247.1 unnamed protein product [Medioppia subpectinata]